MKKIGAFLTFLSLFIFTGYSYNFYNYIGMDKKEILIIQLVYSLILTVIVFYLILIKKICLTKYNIWIIIFLLYILLSIFFRTSNKSISIQNFIILLGITNVILIISSLKSIKYKINIINLYFKFLVYINFLSFFLLKNLSIAYYDDRYTNSLQGLFGHKNILSLYMIVSIIFILYKKNIEKLQLNDYIVLILACINIILSRSSTGLFSLIFLLIVITIMKINDRLSIIIIIGTIISQLFVLFSLYKYISKINFTGRTYIWDYCLSCIKNKFFLGYGFFGFFTSGQHTISQIYVENVAHAHNGILQILLDLGIVGLIIYILIIYNCLRKKSRFYNLNLIAISTIMFFNLTESFLLIQFEVNLCWMLIVFILLNTSKYVEKIY